MLEVQFLAVDPARLAQQISDTLDRLWALGDSRRARSLAHHG